MIRPEYPVVRLTKDLRPGELVRISITGVDVLGIMLYVGADERGIVGALQVDGKASTDTLADYMPSRCVSLGLDWSLEATLGPETFLRDTYAPDPRARLFLTSDGYAMRFNKPMTGRSVPHYFLLDKSELADRIQPSAPIYNWTIWPNEEDHTQAIFNSSQSGEAVN